MNITGQLRDDIKNGQLVVFLGAGASQGAGLPNGSGLANILWKEAGSPPELEPYKNDLMGLAARLDRNPHFTRRWVNNRINNLLLNASNYTNLDAHRGLVALPLKAVYTTNYDLCLELADATTPIRAARLVRIVDGNNRAAVFDSTPGRLPYFKIHGCCRELDERQAAAPPLVISQSDFREGMMRRKNFYDRLKDWAYNCSIVFVGFQAHRSENDALVSHVLDAYNQVSAEMHQPFRPFVVLPNLTTQQAEDLELAGLNPLNGTLQDFVDAALQLAQKPEGESLKPSGTGGSQELQILGGRSKISFNEYSQYLNQFKVYHDETPKWETMPLSDLAPSIISELWKANPSDALLFGNFYVDRDIFPLATDALRDLVSEVSSHRASRILWISGRRGCGKSTVARQLAWYAYHELRQPTVVLNPNASHYYQLDGDQEQVLHSGWNSELLDKFFADLFQGDAQRKVVPVLLADHAAHKAKALNDLIEYLENHGKPCVVLLTISNEELAAAQQDFLGPASRYISRLSRVYVGADLEIPHSVSDGEISRLFQVMSRIKPDVVSQAERLLSLAQDSNYCQRDILMILYTWFDQRYRRFDEIVADEVGYLEQGSTLQRLYISTAVFHQFQFRPRLALCAEGMNVTPEDFATERNKPLFAVLLASERWAKDEALSIGTIRHPLFSRYALEMLVPNIDEQVSVMCKVLECCGLQDLEFARGFLNHIYEYGSMAPELVKRLKEATERHLDFDYVLNHQYAAFLIRDSIDLNSARYYLDWASTASPDNPSIIHSLGNLCYRQYRDALYNDAVKAQEHFDRAREQFARSRALRGEEEHAYYTEIAMLGYRLESQSDTPATRAQLTGERQALLFEALRVIPNDRQNLLRRHLGSEKPFHELPEPERSLLTELIWSGQASHLLLEYYGYSQLTRPREKTRKRLCQLVMLYWDRAHEDLRTATVIVALAKKAFAQPASARFALLLKFYDSAVRYNEAEISFVQLAEYIRLLTIDAFVLGRYQFLKSLIPDIRVLFRHRKPRFLPDEYILPRSYYVFDAASESVLDGMFKEHKDVWGNLHAAARMEGLARVPLGDIDRYLQVEVDPVTGFYIRALRQQLAAKAGNVNVNFAIKHGPDGLLASDLKS